MQDEGAKAKLAEAEAARAGAEAQAAAQQGNQDSTAADMDERTKAKAAAAGLVKVRPHARFQGVTMLRAAWWLLHGCFLMQKQRNSVGGAQCFLSLPAAPGCAVHGGSIAALQLRSQAVQFKTQVRQMEDMRKGLGLPGLCLPARAQRVALGRGVGC